MNSATTPPDFKRDLSFEPVDNSHPAHLTREQIAFYNEHGYIKPLRVFYEAGAQANRAYFDALLESILQMNDGRDPYSINGYHIQCRGLWDIVNHPAILDSVQDILGPDIICWASHFFCKVPGDPKTVPWHQDASYWMFDKSRTVTAWLAIDDADLENACMQVIPGTHKMGHLKWKPTEKDSILAQEIEDAEQLGSPVPFELRAGEMSLHADMLAHGSQPNTSHRRRCGLTIRYCPATVRAFSHWNEQAVVVRGQDRAAHWSNFPRPAGENLAPMAWQIRTG